MHVQYYMLPNPDLPILAPLSNRTIIVGILDLRHAHPSADTPSLSTASGSAPGTNEIYFANCYPLTLMALDNLTTSVKVYIHSFSKTYCARDCPGKYYSLMHICRAEDYGAGEITGTRDFVLHK